MNTRPDLVDYLYKMCFRTGELPRKDVVGQAFRTAVFFGNTEIVMALLPDIRLDEGNQYLAIAAETNKVPLLHILLGDSRCNSAGQRNDALRAAVCSQKWKAALFLLTVADASVLSPREIESLVYLKRYGRAMMETLCKHHFSLMKRWVRGCEIMVYRDGLREYADVHTRLCHSHPGLDVALRYHSFL